MKRILQKGLALGMFLAICPIASANQGMVIRVEIDYMVDETHSHRPAQAEIDAVIAMFACKGVTLIVDIDDAIPHTTLMRCPQPGTDSFFTCVGVDSFAFAKIQHRDQGVGWHYCIFGHQYDNGGTLNSSGIAEILGNDFFVADGVLDGSSNTPFFRAATFAHELGHNLGLRHYAPGSSSTDPHSPNLPSVMSYQYQLRGIKKRMECLGLVGNDHLFKNLDYSSGRMPGFYEGALNESVGMDMRRTDWNCNGSIGGVVSKSLNSSSDWCTQGPGTDFIYDYDEWSAITDVAFAGPGPVEVTTCASMDEMLGGPEGSCSSSAPPLVPEGCSTGKMYFLDPNFTGATQDGTGSRPFQYCNFLPFFPDGSVAYLQPGTITKSTPGSLVLDSPLVLAGPGGALIDP